MADPIIPPPPPGFTLDEVPPPPPGFTLDGPAAPKSTAQKAVELALAPNDAALALGSGMLAGPASGLAGIAGAVLPGPQGQGADWTRRTQEALSYQPRTPGGQAIVERAAAPFEALAKVGDRAGQAASDEAGKLLPPEASAAIGAGVNTVVQSIPQFVGKVAKPALGRAAVLERTRAEVQQKLNAPRDADLKAFQDAGLILPPAEANPNLLNRVLEGFSGQAKVQQLAAEKSQPVLNNIVRKGLGIAPDVPISMETLEAVRKQAGQAYEKVRGLGEIKIDAEYGAALDKIESKYKGAAKSFYEEASPVEKAVESARNTVKAGSFDSSAAVDKIQLERSRADTAFGQKNVELGKAHKAIADAIEKQIQREIDSTNYLPPAAVAEMKQARQLIAKSYDVQKALKGNDVDARVLAAQLKKSPGRLSGDLELAAKFGQRFPGAAAAAGAKNAYTPANAFDFLSGGLAGGASALKFGTPEAIAIAAAAAASRPAVRAGITSRPYQRAMAGPRNYDSPGFASIAEMIASDPALAATYGMQSEGDFRRLKDVQ